MSIVAGVAGQGDAAGAREELVLVTPAGRETEFTAFVRSATPALTRTAWLLCGDVHQADELVQSALVRTYLAWPRARERDPLAYARRALANQRIETWRRRRREVLVAPPDVPDPGRPSDAERVASARQRRVVVLRHFEGLSEREVADDLGISVGTVKSTASRSLARLRDVMGDLDDATGGTRATRSGR